MCEAFSKLNHEVLLISTNASDKNIFDYYDINSRFKFKRLKKFRSFPLGYNYYLFSIKSIIESLKFKPDIYITRNFFTSFLLTIFKKKNILELHHGIEFESRIVKLILKSFNFFNLKSLVRLVAITRSVKTYYEKKFKISEKKIIVSPSGTSIDRIFFNNYIKTNKKLNIGYFGSLFKSRGIDIIIKLSKIDNDNNYFIFGNLNQYKNIKFKSYNSNLYLNNYLPYKLVPNYISKMDILLMPYQEKITVAGNVGNIIEFTSPLKLFDYIACGKPIISSNIKVLKEILKEKKNIIFIKNSKNVFSWKAEIKKIKLLNTKRFIISQNNLKLSKNYKLKNRAKDFLKNLN
ncbi:glycosyltransferase [Candidatus Pelagibacter sp.]|nr:glycosyltransferase [Candidatus Pelagibacter sp.]